MISVEKAFEILENVKCSTSSERIPLLSSAGRILAEDLISTIEMPPYNKSAMDGYAVSSEDSSDNFRILEVIAAGSLPTEKVVPGTCSKIMTGAMMPEGADKVMIVENCNEQDGIMTPDGPQRPGNVCIQGEDVKIGDILLTKGTHIESAEIGVLAAAGRSEVEVFSKPVVGIITTGSEIVEPGNPLKEGQIYNSNTYSIAAQLTAAGAETVYEGIVPDNYDETKNRITDLFNRVDIVVISGGVSMGDFDYVPAVLKEIGVKLHFNKVAIKPGKPSTFGTWKDKFLFGLPGNPVSTFVITELFVKPVLYRIMGSKYRPQVLKGTVETAMKRKRAERASFVPVFYDEGVIKSIEYHGSAHIFALPKANALLEFPAGEDIIPEGSIVNVRSLR